MSEILISATDVKNLRDQTGAGMMDCKKALTESGGDMEKAIDFLRKNGQKLSIKRADRDAKEGVVIAMTSDDRTKGIVIKLSCETDFVAKTDGFINLAKSIAEIALSTMPADLDALLNSKLGNITIGEKISEQVGVIGEKVELSAYESLTAPMVAPYIHMGYRAGVLVGLNKASDAIYEAGRDVAMQVAAMKPIAVDKNSVDSSVVEKEIEIGKEQARLEGKPEAMLDKIAEGRLNKFYQENTLLAQSFVKENKMSVQDYLKSKDADLTVTSFKHVTLG